MLTAIKTTDVERLNAVDEAMQILTEAGITEGIEEMPQFVIVGPQSYGKSAVTSRVIGLKLPSKAGTCTRIAT